MPLRDYNDAPLTTFQPYELGSKPSFEREVFRLCSELNYNAEARYSPVRKSSMRHIYDADAIIQHIGASNDNHRITAQFEKTQWFDFYVNGYEEAATGRLIFREPNEERQIGLKKYLDFKSFTPPISLKAHCMDVSTAPSFIQKNDYQVPDNINIMHGRLRGFFISEEIKPTGRQYDILLITHVLGEPCFRMRNFQFHVNGVSITDIQDQIDGGDAEIVSISDGLANIGKDEGYIWSTPSVASHMHLTDFDWISKGRRISKFTTTPVYAAGDSKSFSLVRYPAQVELTLSLLCPCI